MNRSSNPKKPGLHFFAHLWGDYQWVLLGVLWVFGLALGTIGFSLQADANQKAMTFWDHLYRALQLISLNSGAVDGVVPWQLNVARFFIPILTAATAIKAFASLFQTQMQMLRLSRLRGHVVICGLSKKGIRLVRGFRARGSAVVVIERDEGNDYLDLCRSEGAVVLLGDASDANMLHKAGVQRAHLLVAVCDNDGTNAEIALRAQQITPPHRSDPLTCVIHLVDPQLCHLLRERELSSEENSPFRLEFFNVFEHAARLLLAQHAPFSTIESSARPPRWVVVGLGKMGESLVIQAARRWRERYNHNHHPRLSLTIIDLDAPAKCESLNVRYPQLDSVCEITPLRMDVRSAEFARGAYLFGEEQKCNTDAVYISLDDDSLGLHAGLLVNQLLRHAKIPIIVRMVEDTGLASLLHQGAAHNGYENLHEFSVLDQTCTPELILGGTHEILARALHEEYVRSQGTAGQTPASNPLLVPWEALPPETRKANYLQADHIAIKLRKINRGIAPLTDWVVNKDEFSATEINLLAKMEHERWCAALHRGGWKFAAAPRDPIAKTHPDLVNWEDLPESEKEKNRVSVREIPVFLARAGFQIYQLG